MLLLLTIIPFETSFLTVIPLAKMKPVILIVSLLSLGSRVVYGLPSINANDVSPQLHRDIQDLVRRVSEKRLLADPLTTPIDGECTTIRPLSHLTNTLIVSGDHAFVPPNIEAGDQRGPCPGLNALANHGYISHNGVTSVCISRS